MTLTERQRHDAYDALHQTFGDHTDTVIQMLRPEHDNLVTKADLAIGLGTVRTEMADLRTDLKTEMADLRTELGTGLANLRIEFKVEINEALTAQTRTMMIGLISAIFIIALSNALSLLIA